MDQRPEWLYSARDLYDELPTSWKVHLQQLLRDNLNAHQYKPAFFYIIIDLICKYSARLNLCVDLKDDAKARELRIKGNQMYHPREMKYDAALRFYNESIAFTRKGSTDRAIVYANRSIICLEQEMYGECLVNIRLARESNYPKRFEGLLDVREAKVKAACLAKITSRFHGKRNKAVGNRNNRNHHQGNDRRIVRYNVPNAGCKGKLRQEMASESYPAGTEPMLESDRYTMCDFCQEHRLHTLIPCEGCTMVMYCSEKCLSNARLQYHRYECTIIRNLWNMSGMYAVTVWRTIAKAISSFCDLHAMKEYLERTLQLNQLYDIVDTLHHTLAIAPYHADNNSTLPFRTFLAAIIHRLVLDGTMLGSWCAYDPAMNRLLCDLILHYLNIYREIERT